MLRLAKETKAIGATNAVYLTLWPGESITSILGRIEARLRRAASATERQGDPYARLTELLEAQKTILILDRFENLRREDVAPLCRVITSRRGRYRLIAACQGDPELSAMDRSLIHLERLRPLSVEEVTAIAGQFKVRGAALERLVEDANRGGSVCHPLTLIYMLSLCGEDLPSADFLSRQTARSVNAFKALWNEFGSRLPPDQLQALVNLMRVQLPLAKSVAVKAFGTAVEHLVNGRLVDVIDNEIHVHRLVQQSMGGEDASLSVNAAKTVARHLHKQSELRGEPMLLTRAGQILSVAGATEDAVDTLASGWESIRDFGFLEAYLKTLASIDAPGALEPRIKLLSARARMRKGQPHRVREEMEALARERDKWTRARALVALSFIYSTAGEHKKVIEAYDELRHVTDDQRFLINAGVTAATAMVRVGQVTDAEKLAKSLLDKLKSQKEHEREGELHRLLARVCAQAGRLDDAVREGHAAAKSFEAAGDLYHAATAHGFVGDLYRETGDFELAKEAFRRFHALANQWGDRDLIQIAELAEAWVALDVGDLTHAARQIQSVEREMSAAPSRRLRRYLAAARALLEAGRGHHKEAAIQLARVVEAWEGAGQRAIADILRAQLVRSLIASGDHDQADAMVRKTLQRLDANTAAPRVATFLRESALIRLRHKDVKNAMEELTQARKLFSKGGNRREEALTLHRIAHAALEEGDLELARASAKEALVLARSIRHQRAIALARELQGRVALASDDATEAIDGLKEASQALRRLGDDIGALHVSEWLLRAQIFAGDLAAAIRQGPKVRTHAEKLGVDEVRVRATALSGVAFLRRDRMDAASRCFIELPPGQVSPLTSAMMWRLGEGIAAVQGQPASAAGRRARWVAALRMLPGHRLPMATKVLEQLGVPPRDRCRVRTHESERVVGVEDVGLLEPAHYELYVDTLSGVAYVEGARAEVPASVGRFLGLLLAFAPEVAPFDSIYQGMFDEEPDDKPDKRLKGPIKDLKKALRKSKGFDVTIGARGLEVSTPATYAFVVPTFMTSAEITDRQRHMMQLLGRLGVAPLQAVQEKFDLTRAAARRELGELVQRGLVETVRDGRGQAFRLA